MKSPFRKIIDAISVAWVNIADIPATFTPASHGDSAHSETYLKDGDSAFNEVTGINTQTGTTYTTVLTDAGKIIDHENVSAITDTIPPQSSVPYPLYTVMFFRQKGAGVITLTEGAGVTLSGEVKSNGQNTGLAAIQIATNIWWIIGGVA